MSVTKYTDRTMWDDEYFGFDIKRKNKRAQERAWKQEVQEELGERVDMASVFVVINEWQDIATSGPCAENESVWSTFEKAHRELSRVAQTYEIYLDLDQDNFVLEDTQGGLVYDEYRIEEYGVDVDAG